MKKLNVLAGIGCAALMSYGVVAQAGDVVTVSQTNSVFKVTLVSNSGNSGKNWTYKIEKISGQDLSHWDLSLGSCLGKVTNTGGGSKQPTGDPSNANPSPASGTTVDTTVKSSPLIKWDTSGGTFTITMDKAYEKKDVPVLTKSATKYSTGLVSGPDCTKEVVAIVDTDQDGVADSTDNCPAVANTNQADADKDGMGDACESDTDKDSVIDDSDNCPAIANTNQADADKDGMGDACESDTDKDGVIDDSDNCPVDMNANQADVDSDGKGDACDDKDDRPVVTPPTDTDEDGVPDDSDNCPSKPNADQADTNGDGKGDACEVTYGDSNASVVGIWKYVGSMSVQDFDATYKEGTDYVFTGDDSGEYLLQGIDDEGKTTSMSGAKMK